MKNVKNGLFNIEKIFITSNWFDDKTLEQEMKNERVVVFIELFTWHCAFLPNDFCFSKYFFFVSMFGFAHLVFFVYNQKSIFAWWFFPSFFEWQITVIFFFESDSLFQ